MKPCLPSLPGDGRDTCPWRYKGPMRPSDHFINNLMSTSIPLPEGTPWVELKSYTSSLIRIWLIHEPKERCQASHRFIQPVVSARFKWTSKAQTSESFQIWCKGTANEEAKGEKLLSDKVGLRHSISSHVLATRRARASDRSDAWALLRRDRPILLYSSFRSPYITWNRRYSPMRKILQL